jgi:rSAM/selenodomain-associated transferase 1
MSDAALVIMAKHPLPGRTKTRLTPPLTPDQAAALYEALLRDTIELAAGIDTVDLAVAVTPPEAIDYFRPLVPSGTRLLPVECPHIGSCLNQVLAALLQDHMKAAALNSDGPTVPAAYLRQAFVELDDHDVVIGPSEDGGYYLIGLRQPWPALFEGIVWSSPSVTPQTVARAQELGLRVSLLPIWHDVDMVADLERLRCEVLTLPLQTLVHTRHFFSWDY